MLFEQPGGQSGSDCKNDELAKHGSTPDQNTPNNIKRMMTLMGTPSNQAMIGM
jgi:hypothetical protein